MKKQSPDVCPGCGKHCPAAAVRCKYGRAHFAKLAEESAAPEKGKHRRKWEKHVAADGPLWQLISTGRRVKKALLGGEIREEQLLTRLTGDEQRQLTEILRKMC